MKKRLLLALAVLALLAVLRTAGGVAFWSRYLAELGGVGAAAAVRLDGPRLPLRAEPAAAPRADAAAEYLLPAALSATRDEAVKQGLSAFVVDRHGHRVFEYFAGDRHGDTLVDGGEMAVLPFALSLGVLADSGRVDFDTAVRTVRDAAQPGLAWHNPWSQGARARFSLHAAPPLLLRDADGGAAATISERVWLPLRAGPASLWGRDDTALRVDCCVVARLDDWMRLADLLLQQGSFEGEHIASPDWIRHLLATEASGRAHPVWLDAQQPWKGDEPPLERDTYWFDLGPDLRLWLVPSRGLAMAQWGEGGKARDTLVPNIILRGLTDPAPRIEGNLNDLVPGHY